MARGLNKTKAMGSQQQLQGYTRDVTAQEALYSLHARAGAVCLRVRVCFESFDLRPLQQHNIGRKQTPLGRRTLLLATGIYLNSLDPSDS